MTRYQSWNTRRGGMSNGGAIRAAEGQALTRDELAANVPAVLASDAHHSRSERFKPISTMDVIYGLAREGFQVVFAQQMRTRDASRREFCKHVVRLRHPDIVNADGTAFEIILTNGNDGSSAWRMLPGFFRFICMNGLFLGDAFPGVTVRHSGDAVSKVVAGAFDVLETAESVAARIDAWRSLYVSPANALQLAHAAHFIRFPNAWERGEDGDMMLTPHAAPTDPADFLTIRRPEDNGDDLFTVWNRVQENMQRGGFSGRIRSDRSRRGWRNATQREIGGITQTETANQRLTNAAVKLADILS